VAAFRNVRNVRGFFSDYYLGTVFGASHGRKRRLSDRSTDFSYRRFHKLWRGAEGKAGDASLNREKFIRPLLRDILGFHLGAGYGRVHGLHSSADREDQGHPPLLLAYAGAWDEDLDAGQGSERPMHRFAARLAQDGIAYGLLITGERLRLTRAEGDGPRRAYLEVDLAGLVEEEDPESFAAFLRLVSCTTFLLEAPGRASLIQTIERESREHSQQVSEDLKRAVFEAAESLIEALLRDAEQAGRLSDRTLLTEAELKSWRDAALTGLYRILFILYAEARDPRLEQHPIYRQSYSLEGLVEDLNRDPSREWPENRTFLWARLKALFRIFDVGLPAIGVWENIPPRGGDFFNASTHEGRTLEAARLPDQIVARVVLTLTTAEPRAGIGRERVSFRELDIESLGSVYEGLLEREPRIAGPAAIEAEVAGRSLVLEADELAGLCGERGLRVGGDSAILASTPAVASLHDDGAGSPRATESGDRPRRGAQALLIRRLGPHAFHFISSSARKGSGSFYTPTRLVQDLVVHSLQPLVEGRKPDSIESLRILDPACGSAHFLVGAMRFLGQALHRSYVEDLAGRPPTQFRSTTGQGWDLDWQASDEEARRSNSEARAWCKRRIAERCLFGVDLNPTAVSLARVALWIESLAGDRPLTYFEHHVRCGNSLLGTWFKRLDRPPLAKKEARISSNQLELPGEVLRDMVAEAAEARRGIDRYDPDALRREGIEPESVEEQAHKDRLRRKADDLLGRARLLFDLRSASLFVPEIWRDWLTLFGHIGSLGDLESFSWSRPWWDEFARVRDRERFFHWELEFPEVLRDPVRPSFDVVLGNPPWDKVLPTKAEFYGRRDVLIRAYKGQDRDRRIRELVEKTPELREEFTAYRSRMKSVAQFLRRGGDFAHARSRSPAAHEDVSKYFVDRAIRLAADGGRVGLVVPSVLYNGDGCVGLREYLLKKATIERFYGFENRRKHFPIDSRYKFVDLVFRKGGGGDSFLAAFMRHDLQELADIGEKPWMVRITREEIERLSPETFAFLEYREPKDQRIVAKMHAGRPTLGTRSGGWGATFVSWRAHEIIFNASEDKDLWTDPKTGRLHSPAQVLGREPDDFGETVRLMRDRGFWPVFEGKHLDQFVVGIKRVRWWLSVAQAQAKYGKLPRNAPTLVFRETASNTNERTCIAAVLPAGVAASHKLSGILLDGVDGEAALVVLNSFCFDWALRLRTAGTNVSFTYIRPMPVPPAVTLKSLPRIPTIRAWEMGIHHVTANQTQWSVLWDSNRGVAEAFGLSAGDFAYILETGFPGFRRKRAAFHEYLRQRLTEWRAEEDRTAQALPMVAETPTDGP